MNFAGWRNPGGVSLRNYNLDANFTITEVAKTLGPGESAQWRHAITVEGRNLGQTLVVVASVAYNDALGTFREFSLARRYDPSAGRFQYEYNPNEDSRFSAEQRL